jgi:hypothetical protein
MGLIGENGSIRDKILSAMSTVNSTWTGLGSNSDVRGESSTTDGLNYGLARIHLQFLLAVNRQNGCLKVPKM